MSSSSRGGDGETVRRHATPYTIVRGSARVVGLVWHKTFEDRILGMAAEAGFWALVSLPSMFLAIFGALGYFHTLIGPGSIAHIRADVLRAAGDVLTPSTVASDVAPLVDQVLAKGQAEVISIGFLISLWSGSTAMSDYLNTITVAYGMRGLRSAVRSRLVALWLYICALVAGIVLLPALALGPTLLAELFPDSVQDQVSSAIHVAYWPVLAVGTVAALAYLYKACLPAPVRWRRGLPGATVAMGLWLAFSFTVRAYLTSSFRGRSVYGSLAAPIAGLLFFYFTALAVLLGAELNSAIDALHPVPATTDARRRSALGEELRAALPAPARKGILRLRRFRRPATGSFPVTPPAPEPSPSRLPAAGAGSEVPPPAIDAGVGRPPAR